ncbi:hypothetical protein ACFL3V_03525 [Nanoarchaeota archaeon]
MPDRKIPQIEIYDNGFYIKYNGVGVLALKPHRERELYHIELFKLVYGLGDVIEKEKHLGRRIQMPFDLEHEFGKMKLARRVRLATQNMCRHEQFGDADEFRMYQLLSKYATPDDSGRGGRAAQSRTEYIKKREQRDVDRIRGMFTNNNGTTLEEKI